MPRMRKIEVQKMWWYKENNPLYLALLIVQYMV